MESCSSDRFLELVQPPYRGFNPSGRGSLALRPSRLTLQNLSLQHGKACIMCGNPYGNLMIIAFAMGSFKISGTEIIAYKLHAQCSDGFHSTV